MNTKKIIEALNITINGLTLLRDELENGGAEAPATKPAKGKAPKKVEEPMNEPEVEETPEENTAGDIDVEQLKKMKYNEFKKYASSLGVNCKGTRDEIMERILALKDGAVEETVDETPEEVVEETPSKSDKSKSSKKLGKAKASEPAKDEFDEQAEEIAKDTPVEDIIEALADVDVKATKKNAVQKLAHALREGLIELDDDEEEDSSAEDGSEEVTAEEVIAETYSPEFDPKGYNDPANMTDARKDAVVEKMQEILDAIETEELTEDDITSYIEENASEKEIDLLGDDYDEEALIKFYMELVKRTIDNDGDEHEPSDPYEVNDVDMCCGHELKYVKKTKKYVCEVCGTEYEAE